MVFQYIRHRANRVSLVISVGCRHWRLLLLLIGGQAVIYVLLLVELVPIVHGAAFSAGSLMSHHLCVVVLELVLLCRLYHHQDPLIRFFISVTRERVVSSIYC